MIRTFLAESLLAIYRNWIEGGKKLTVDKVISLTTDLLVDGVKRYMKLSYEIAKKDVNRDVNHLDYFHQISITQ